MPIYTYKCPKGHITEDLRAIKDRDISKPCPECGVKTKKIISQTQPPIFVTRPGGHSIIDGTKEF
jgi:putative FmdB family regulatory protein